MSFGTEKLLTPWSVCYFNISCIVVSTLFGFSSQMLVDFEQVDDKKTDSIRRLNKKILEDDRVGISMVSTVIYLPFVIFKPP